MVLASTEGVVVDDVLSSIAAVVVLFSAVVEIVVAKGRAHRASSCPDGCRPSSYALLPPAIMSAGVRKPEDELPTLSVQYLYRATALGSHGSAHTCGFENKKSNIKNMRNMRKMSSL
jgi:hypothetical protein